MHNFLHKPLIKEILKGRSPQMMKKKEQNQQLLKQVENDAGK